MRFDRESWRRLYRHEPLEQRAWPLFTRAIRDHLVALAEDDGRLVRASGDSAAESLASALMVHDSEREAALVAISMLLSAGVLALRDGWVVYQNFGRFLLSDVFTEPDARPPNCSYCGSLLNWGNRALRDGATWDHVFPRCRGGGHDPSNLVAACRTCNCRKGGRTPREAGMDLQ
jgi:hypothetical protein